MSTDSSSAPLRSWRIGALAIAVAATGLSVVVGCTRLTAGHGSAPSASVAEYQSFVTQSLATSRVEESKRQETLTQQAQADVCTTYAMTSGAVVTAGNDLMATINNEGGYGSSASAKVGPFIDALNKSADQVDDARAQAKTQELNDALGGYSDQARKLAAAFQSRLVNDPLNVVVNGFNDARNKAGEACLPFLPQKPR